MEKIIQRTRTWSSTSLSSSNQLNPGREFDREKLAISLEVVKDLTKNNEKFTIECIAMKNNDCYMILTSTKKFKIFEKNTLVFSTKTPFETNISHEVSIIYINDLECFLISFLGVLYRKDIDNKPPYFFMDISSISPKDHTRFHYDILRYSEANRKLISFLKCKYFTVVDLQRKKVELQLRFRRDDRVEYFRLFGKDRNKVLAVTQKGYILLYILNYQMRKVLAHNELWIPLLDDVDGSGINLAVCDRHKYALVVVANSRSITSIELIQIRGSFLEKRASIVEPSTCERFSKSLEFYDYVGNHILWIGLSITCSDRAKIYDYNTETGELTELREKTVNHQVTLPTRIHRLNDGLYYAGYPGRLMKLNIRS